MIVGIYTRVTHKVQSSVAKITVCCCKGMIVQDLACPHSMLSLCFYVIIIWFFCRAVQSVHCNAGWLAIWLAGWLTCFQCLIAYLSWFPPSGLCFPCLHLPLVTQLPQAPKLPSSSPAQIQAQNPSNVELMLFLSHQ